MLRELLPAFLVDKLDYLTSRLVRNYTLGQHSEVLLNKEEISSSASYCPNVLVTSKLLNGWFTFRFGGGLSTWDVIEAFPNNVKLYRLETYDRTKWIRYPMVRFLVSRHYGTTYEIQFDLKKIIERGKILFLNRKDPEWGLYVNSVVLAHLEVLKFSEKHVLYNLPVISRILSLHGGNALEELLDVD